jgi:hypothetical protein
MTFFIPIPPTDGPFGLGSASGSIGTYARTHGQPAHLRADILKSSPRNAFPCHKNKAIVSLQLGQNGAERFLHASAGAVPHHAVPHLFTDGKTGPYASIPALYGNERHIARARRLSPPVNKAELLVFFQRANVHLRLRRQDLPAFCTSSLQNIAASFRLHSLHKAVHAAALQFFWLIRHLHNYISPFSTIIYSLPASGRNARRQHVFSDKKTIIII